jgi:hypothetical protein
MVKLPSGLTDCLATTYLLRSRRIVALSITNVKSRPDSAICWVGITLRVYVVVKAVQQINEDPKIRTVGDYLDGVHR